MREVWSLASQRRLWRQIWVALAEAQQEAGLVTSAQVAELRERMSDIDLDRAQEIEAEIHHDLMAEVHTYAEQCPHAGGIIHLGATSMDIEDNADALRLRAGLGIIVSRLQTLLNTLAECIELRANQVCMAFTHLQPAETTTVGYRLANYAQDLLADWETLNQVRDGLRGKGLKGAVGTSASYSALLNGTGMTAQELEAQVMAALDLEAYPVAHQTYPRRQEWLVLTALAGVAMTIYRLGFDIRLLQSPPFGEWAEPFGSKQVGSSAMPFKRNPINAENLDSLARFVASLPRVAWDNAAHCLLERTLDDSGNRRVMLPESFLATDELLMRGNRVVAGLQFDDVGIQRNLAKYGVFAATERLLMEVVRQGGNRQVLHEIIRRHSLASWEMIRLGGENPLKELLSSDDRITRFVPPQQVRELLQAEEYVGDAPDRALAMAEVIRGTASGDT